MRLLSQVAIDVPFDRSMAKSLVKASLLTLPNELLLLIADLLPLSHVGNLRRTCKRIYRVLKRLNRKRMECTDIFDLSDLDMDIQQRESRYFGSTALEIAAVTVLPPSNQRPDVLHSTSITSLSDVLMTSCPNLVYFSLHLLPECDISYVPPPTPLIPGYSGDLRLAYGRHATLTHLSILNFRVPPSFLSLFPSLVEAVLVLHLSPAQNSLVHLQYQPRDIQSLIKALPSGVRRLILSCTAVVPEMVRLAAQHLGNLEALAFMWMPSPWSGSTNCSAGVETTDISFSIKDYARALAPVAKTLKRLYLPACIGRIGKLDEGDEMLGSGEVVQGGGKVELGGVNGPWRKTRVQCGMVDMVRACRELVSPLKTQLTTAFDGGQEVGLDQLETVGFLIPQGDGLPLLPMECVRKKGVVAFGSRLHPFLTPVHSVHPTPHHSTRPSRATTPFSRNGSPAVPTVFLPQPIPATIPEADDYWYPSMELWNNPHDGESVQAGIAWPTFSEIEAVFPRPAYLSYSPTMQQ